MRITTTTSFFQDPVMSFAPRISPSFFQFVPSWLTILGTIGVTNETYDDGEPISTIASPDPDGNLSLKQVETPWPTTGLGGLVRRAHPRQQRGGSDGEICCSIDH